MISIRFILLFILKYCYQKKEELERFKEEISNEIEKAKKSQDPAPNQFIKNEDNSKRLEKVEYLDNGAIPNQHPEHGNAKRLSEIDYQGLFTKTLSEWIRESLLV